MVHSKEKPIYYDGSVKAFSLKQPVSTQTVVTPVSTKDLIKFPCFPYLK